MATFKSVEVTAKEVSSGEKYDARTSAGHIKTAEFTYTTVGTEAAADVIELVDLISKAKQLILSHRMRRTLGREDETLAEIRRHYSNPVLFADDMNCFTPR